MYCRPKVEYASELWEGVIRGSWVAKLESLQTMVMRVALGTPDNASAAGMRAECGLQTLVSRRWAARLTFFRKLAAAPRGNLASIIFRYRCSEVDAGGANRSWCHRTKSLLSQLSLGPWWHGLGSRASSVSPGPCARAQAPGLLPTPATKTTTGPMGPCTMCSLVVA